MLLLRRGHNRQLFVSRSIICFHELQMHVILISFARNFYSVSVESLSIIIFFVMAKLCIQGGEPKYRKAWAQICEISRKEFDGVYQRLGIQLEEKVSLPYVLYIMPVG